ncbi:hypothetical protein [Patulibacter minatonensis]|uniref:hypothetical protein n=1 Tax=Patulibacter minatonensis TaxID=298163 RepID=UPI00047EF903|nr:hypothetical protein [Patulibacter minatonensis]
MSTETRETVLIGREPCGCITLVDCMPHLMGREQKREVAKFVADGGDILRLGSLDEAKALGNFLPAKCPHSPIGWGPEKGKHAQPSLLDVPAAGQEQER